MTLYDPSVGGRVIKARELDGVGKALDMMMSGPQTTSIYLTLRGRVSALEAQHGGMGRMESIVLDSYHKQNGRG